jgi:hypothetical protein
MELLLMNKMPSDFSQGDKEYFRILPFDPRYAGKIQASYELAMETAAKRGIEEDLMDY